MVRNAPHLFTKEMSRKFFRARMEVAEVDTLVALARKGDKDALDILRKHARGARTARDVARMVAFVTPMKLADQRGRTSAGKVYLRSDGGDT